MQDEINRRRFLRIVFPYTIHIFPKNKEVISTYTENISEGGVKIVIFESLDLSSTVKLEIYLRENPIVCEGKVIWIREKESQYLEARKIYEIGIEFLNLKNIDRLMIRDCVEEVKRAQPSDFL